MTPRPGYLPTAPTPCRLQKFRYKKSGPDRHSSRVVLSSVHAGSTKLRIVDVDAAAFR